MTDNISISNSDRYTRALWETVYATRLVDPTLVAAAGFEYYLEPGLALKAVYDENGVFEHYAPYLPVVGVNFATETVSAILVEKYGYQPGTHTPAKLKVIEFGIIRDLNLHGFDSSLTPPLTPEQDQIPLKAPDFDSMRSSGLIVLEVDNQALFDNGGGS